MPLSIKQKAGIGSGAIIIIFILICLICFCCLLSSLSLYSYSSFSPIDSTSEDIPSEDVSPSDTSNNDTTDPLNEYGDVVTDPENNNQNDAGKILAALYSNNELTKVSGSIKESGSKKLGKTEVRGVKIRNGYVMALYDDNKKIIKIDTTTKSNVTVLSGTVKFKKDIYAYYSIIKKK